MDYLKHKKKKFIYPDWRGPNYEEKCQCREHLSIIVVLLTSMIYLNLLQNFKSGTIQKLHNPFLD